jgi:hypothetical protein
MLSRMHRMPDGRKYLFLAALLALAAVALIVATAIY